MSGKPTIADLLQLTVDERIQLVDELWESIASVPESIQLTDAQREELEARLAEYRSNPNAGSPWQEVRDRLLRQL